MCTFDFSLEYQTLLQSGCTVCTLIKEYKSFQLLHSYANTYCPLFLFYLLQWLCDGVIIWY